MVGMTVFFTYKEDFKVFQEHFFVYVKFIRESSITL